MSAGLVFSGGIQRGDLFRSYAPNPLFQGEPAGVAGVGGPPTRCAFPLGESGKGGVNGVDARLVPGPGGGRVQAVMMCACGSLEVVARGMCPRCLARQHHDKEYFGGKRERVLERDNWTCQGCFYRPSQEDRDYIVVHNRRPGVSKVELMISLCAACHAIVERLKVVRTWLPPQLLILWREQHPGVEYQLQLALTRIGGAGEFNPRVIELDL